MDVDLRVDLAIGLGGMAFGALTVLSIAAIWYKLTIKKRDRAVLSALLVNIEENQATSRENINAINSELGYLQHNKTLTAPLLMLDDGVWQLIKLQLPRRIASDQHMIRRISYLYKSMAAANVQTNSREAYRIANNGKKDFITRMEQYDFALQKTLEELWENLLIMEEDIRDTIRFPQTLFRFLRKLISGL